MLFFALVLRPYHLGVRFQPRKGGMLRLDAHGQQVAHRELARCLHLHAGAGKVHANPVNFLPSIGLPPMGLVVAIYALTLIASLAGDQFQLKGVLVLATVLSVGSYLAFVVALNLQFPVWPTFITG